MEALDYLLAGRFAEAISAYESELRLDPDDISAIAGLASSYMGAGNYSAAIPLKMRVHDHEKRNPDHPGQHLYLAVAYWCLEDRHRAMELAHNLCAAILDGTVSMAPDLAGGATFGLVLHYMALTAGDDVNREYALNFLRKLNVKYNRHPSMFRYPVATVKQVLGEASFEEALESATGNRGLAAAQRAAERDRSVMLRLGIVLFHDGAIRRAIGDEIGCKGRMQEVFDLGYQTDSISWYLARHEVAYTRRRHS
jgi:tetratricopeptide (TPR) repeat protein